MTATTTADMMCARISSKLAQDLGPRRYAMWFDRSALLDYREHEQELEVAVPNRFVAEWISKNFDSHLQAAAENELGHSVTLNIQVQAHRFDGLADSQAVASSVGRDTSKGKTSSHQNDGKAGVSLKPVVSKTTISRRSGAVDMPEHRRASRTALRHHLDNFIVGPSNELVYAAACRLGDLEQSQATPLFVHGGCGLGKTHLLQGICRRVLDQNPEARVMYFTSEAFTNEFLAAVRSNNVASFRNKIRRLDLLAVDDIHFIANKQATQQEFLHCFDAIDLGGARVVLASDSHPKLIKQFSEALVSRCVRGLVVEVRSPDAVTRARLIRAIAAKRGINLMDSVVEVLASRCSGSVRDIEGLLTKLHALAGLSPRHTSPAREGVAALGGNASDGNDLTSEAARTADLQQTGGGIGHMLVNQLFAAELSHAPRHAIRFESIMDVVSQQMGVSKALIAGSGRKQVQVLARSLVIHLTRQMTNMSYPEIAAAMGKGAHSTIITADQRIIGQLAADKKVLVPQTMEELSLLDLVDRLKLAIQKV